MAAVRTRPPHRDPIAFFLTWTTYASWLPGDPRGWADSAGVIRLPSPVVHRAATNRLPAPASSLDPRQRAIVARCIHRHASIKSWIVHAAECRMQHVLVVVTAPRHAPKAVIQQLKTWSSRMLDDSEADSPRPRWWTRGGSGRLVFDEAGLERVVAYVREWQDVPRTPR